MLPTRNSLQLQGHIQAESEVMGTDIPCKQKPKEREGIPILISDQNFKSKTVARDKGHYNGKFKFNSSEQNHQRGERPIC